MNRYKIASRTVVDNPDLCRQIIAAGRETFVSLGMWKGKRDFPFEGANVRYLYCRSVYPTRYEDVKDFPQQFDRHYGYSDHMMGIEGCLLAIARGAKLVEKHFTLNKTSSVIRDHGLSATPDEFRRLTELGSDLSRLSMALSADPELRS